MLYEIAEIAVKAVHKLVDIEKRKERLYEFSPEKHPGYRDLKERFARNHFQSRSNSPAKQKRLEKRRDTHETNHHSVVGENVTVYNFGASFNPNDPFDGVLMSLPQRKPRHPKGRPRPQRVF